MSYKPNLSNFKDVDFGFEKNSLTDDVKVRREISSISQSIKNIILTSPKERPFSRFGFGLYDYLNTINDLGTVITIKNGISSLIQKYEPRVRVSPNDINVNIRSTNSIEINMTYRLADDLSGNYTQNLTISVGEV